MALGGRRRARHPSLWPLWEMGSAIFPHEVAERYLGASAAMAVEDAHFTLKWIRLRNGWLREWQGL
jgi:hypothetical protein